MEEKELKNEIKRIRKKLSKRWNRLIDDGKDGKKTKRLELADSNLKKAIKELEG